MSGLGQIPNLPPSTTRSDYDQDSSASSGQKRKRDGSPTQSTSFLQTAKNLVAQRTNVTRCWNCEAPHIEFCHVIARADPAYPAMVKKGMITFGALGDYRNAIVLCGGCHNHFDRTSNTGWVFLPTQLDWFIEWEERDFANRKQIFEQTGRGIERTYPSEEDYENHLRAIGVLSDPNDGMYRGGLYHSYILEDMFAPYMMVALRQQGMTVPGIFPGGPKRWHGAPMAAINRGFVVTGAPEMKLPEKEWDLLHTLQRLYSRKLPELTGSEVGSGGTIQGGASERRLAQQHEATAARGQQGNASMTAKPAAPENQLLSSGLRDASSQDNHTDSAIDMRSRKGRITKRRQEDGSTRDSDRSEFKVENSRNDRRHRKRRRLQDDFAEEELGVDEESWCFGPETSSNDKIEVHIGKGRRVEVPGQMATESTSHLKVGKRTMDNMIDHYFSGQQDLKFWDVELMCLATEEAASRTTNLKTADAL